MIHRVHLSAHPRHLGWVSRAVVSGFLGSIAAALVLLGAYGFASATGSTSANANVFSAWMWALANNPATKLVASIHLVQAVGLHLVAGGMQQGSDATLLSATGGATEGAIAGWVVGTFVGLITSGSSAESGAPM